MAAGTEVTQPVSAIDGAPYKDLPLDTRYTGVEKGIVGDDSTCQSQTGTLQIGYMDTTMLEHGFSMDHNKVESCQLDSCSSFSNTPAVVEFKPVIRSGVCFDVGNRQVMEDEHVRIDDLVDYLGSVTTDKGPKSCYGVFDGHGGKDAAQFARDKLLKFILQDVSFPSEIEEAVHHGFLETDKAFAEACSVDNRLSSGTTAIMALVLGRKVLVANAGDCRAVLCRRGKAFDMSRDHKPCCLEERSRIQALGGFVVDGYLNGQLGVARALGDWHMEGLKGVGCPLSAEPEVEQILLTEDDEFLIIGCDGFWDVFSSQLAVDLARIRLQQHNDPEQCCRELVAEALRRGTSDNLTVVVVCFQVNPPPRLITSVLVRKSISSQGLRNLQDVLDSILD